MLKLYVIGPRADILPFKAIGAELIEIQNGSVTNILEKLMQSTDQLLVMMTEELASSARAEIDTFRKKTNSIFLPIPSMSTHPGTRLKEVQQMIAKSLGVDLLGQKLAESSKPL